MMRIRSKGSRASLAFATILIAALVLAACGAPGADTPFPPDMQTAAALTVEALLSATPESTATSAVTATPIILTATAVGSPGTPVTPTASTETPSAGAARMTVEDITNCRKGPGTGYELVTQITAGEEVSILGSLPDYWLVQTGEGQCWVATEFATPIGNIAAVPTVTAPPTPQGGELGAPSISEWTYACTGNGRADLTIKWTDRASTESGYRIYMNAEVIKELPANSTEFSSSVLVPAGTTVEFYVEAFNTGGATSSVVYKFSC